ncbi:glycoside hydrolase family 43 protein [Maribacter dokdonensis]|uniref:glycoside hydrolase family 43 protein n=1 Tax=Maribacter dokdonensis TaxID=320912 RepID=UPI0007199856|nr:glycoside hydrolase family 43 protein [Maribacter dokdonensis]
MRKLISILFLLILFSCSKKDSEIYLFSYFKGNGEDGLHLASSEDGLKWEALNNDKSFLEPNIGKDKLMRDPCIVKGGDNKFHMVWTVSWNERGIGYASSTNLIDWSEQKYIPIMHHEPDAVNCWAPELFYDEASELYLICWATTIPGRFPETDDSNGNGRNHRMYYTTTKDFVDFSETKMLYDQGFNVIDATIQKEDDTYIMFLKNETKLPKVEKNIRIATSNTLTDNYSEASEPISPNWVEGPTAIKIENRWIVYYDMYTEKKMGAVSSSDLKEWKDISDKISFPEGTRHGTVFKVKESILTDIISLHNNGYSK